MGRPIRQWGSIALLASAFVSTVASAESLAWRDYLNKAQKALENGHFAEAERYYETARAQKGSQRARVVELARIANNLAVVAETRGQLAVAESYAERAFEFIGESIDEEQELAGTIQNNLAEIYHDQERYQDAKHAYLRGARHSSKRS